jgi:hypothetical protein
MVQLIPAQEEESLWQGRPAPRCYTFQYWKQALIGSALFLLSSFWLLLALELIADGQPMWLAFLPIPLILGSFYFGPMQILLARLTWAKVFYQMTTKTLYLPAGKNLQLAEVVEVKIKKQGESLASLRITAAGSKPAILHCVEHPEILLALLKEHCPQLKV